MCALTGFVGAEHTMSDNIINLVLAKTGDSGGIKDISLFIVPKFLMNEDGSIGERNDISLVGKFYDWLLYYFLQG